MILGDKIGVNNGKERADTLSKFDGDTVGVSDGESDGELLG